MHLFPDAEAESIGDADDLINPDDLDKSKPLVLLLGNIDHEGITSHLKASGEQYKKKLLESKHQNWLSILGYFDTFPIRAVIIKLNGKVYDLLARPEYSFVGNELLSRIAKVRHAAFVFQNLLSGEDQPADHVFWPVEASVGKKVNLLLHQHGLNVIPYRRNADLTVIATEFLREALEQLLFRVYVPAGRLWATELDRLLELFRDYLSKTGRKGVRLEQIRTDRGIAYEFHGDDSSDSSSLSEDFQDFSKLLDLCVADPSQAEEILKKRSVEQNEVSEILTRYSKEARRLQTDLKHDRERKLLSIRQRLESELTDVLLPPNGWELINLLVEKAIPSAANIGRAYWIGTNDPNKSLQLDLRQLTVNLNPQIINTVNGLVAHEINGSVNFSREDQELLELIRAHGGNRTVELASAVQEISDPGLAKPIRLSRGEQLKAFLYSVGPKLGSTAVNVLQSYIEQKLGLK